MEGFRGWFAGLLCEDCLDDFTPVRSPMCTRCGTMFAGEAAGDHLCGDCLRVTDGFSRARAAGLYDGTLLALVHAYKYRACTELARPLGRLLLEVARGFWARGGIDGVVPVPLHRRRLRRRGFNQAELLVRQWRDAGGRRPWPLLTGALIRLRPTPAQTGLGRKDRLANMKGAFAPGPEAVAGKRLLLVDDVYTTGATAAACSRVLTAAGAARVEVVTLARSIPDLTPSPNFR